MKLSHTQPSKKNRQGFTLVELLVAMVVTMVIIGVLTAMTRVAVTGMQNAQKNTRTARIAQEVTSTVAKDLEGIVIRNNNDFQWVRVQKSNANLGPAQATLKNPLEIIFYSAVTDRYDGNLSEDKGGDISLIRYRLEYKDVILNDNNDKTSIFSLYRKRIEPNDAFTKNLNKPLKQFKGQVTGNDYLAENIYDFTISFNFVAMSNGKTIYRRVPIQIDGDNTSLLITGKGVYLNLPPDQDANENNLLKFKDYPDATSARLHSVDVSILVLSDAGMKGLSKANLGNDNVKLSNYLKEYGKHYSKTIFLPRP